MSGEQTVIQVRGLTKRFGDFTAVDHISFDVQAGEVVGYLGPNGSGKTTTIRMLLGLLRPSEGEGSVLGYDVRRQAEQLRQEVGYMSQKFALYNDLTVSENLAFYAGVYGTTDRSRLGEVIELLGLRGLERVRVSNISVGWRQRLALGTAIVHRPRLLFLDEPTSGVDPNARRAFWELIYAVVAEGVTALVTTHYMDEAERCDRIAFINDGKIIACDTPANLKSTAMKGLLYEIECDRMIEALEKIKNLDYVMDFALYGVFIHVLLADEKCADRLKSDLAVEGVKACRIDRASPSLEDVFVFLVEKKTVAGVCP